MSTKTIQTTNYDELLFNAIPFLKSLPCNCGGEGVAYFLGDNFVVKEYSDSSNWERFEYVFDAYCKEIQSFAQQGFNVPQIYSWLRVPNKNYSSSKNANRFNYYILEERVPGRNLYYGFLEDFYPACRDLFDEKEYNEVVYSPESNLEMFDEIIKAYVKDYIQMNEFLLSVSENELAKFIVDSFNMHTESQFGDIDLFPSNIIVNNDKLTLIDNHINIRGRADETHERKVDDFVNRVAFLASYNDTVFDLENSVMFKLNGYEFDKDYSVFQEKNRKLCMAATQRLIDVMNKYCDNPKCVNRDNFLFTYLSLQKLFGKEDSIKILKNVNVGFEPMF